mmetsp:Transcript_3102/g.7737  ORF Transcript_3102/g.7737 Transcript_3102/m.7737 type:complete len:94 (-) Transcript_3102:398-679(-)
MHTRNLQRCPLKLRAAPCLVPHAWVRMIGIRAKQATSEQVAFTATQLGCPHQPVSRPSSWEQWYERLIAAKSRLDKVIIIARRSSAGPMLKKM